MVIGDDNITGTLKYVTGYTEFSGTPGEQEGNYIALKINDGDDPRTVTTVEVVGGTKGPVTLDEDMNIVLLIKNKDTQDITVKATTGDHSVTKTYDLSGLTLEPKPVEEEEGDE